MDKVAMLEELISTFTDGNKSRFSKILGIKPQTINTWLARGTFDAELIYAKCDGVSGDWLLSGDGPILKSDRGTHNTEKKLVTLCQSLIGIYEQKESVMGELAAMVRELDK